MDIEYPSSSYSSFQLCRVVAYCGRIPDTTLALWLFGCGFV